MRWSTLPRTVGRLTTRDVRGTADVVAHFDRAAPHYHEAHGPADQLLAYRLGVIEPLLAGAERGTLLEIGCGTGINLLPLAENFARVIGTDISPEMVRVARSRAEGADRITIEVDPAEQLATVADGSVDAAICVGALEHMLDKPGALRQVKRVLRPGGVFVALTPNGDYCWYRHAAPLLRRETKHLSTDHFLTMAELDVLLGDAGLDVVARRHWSFVPQGDLPVGWGPPLRALDRLGEWASIGYLRGGIAVAAVKR